MVYKEFIIRPANNEDVPFIKKVVFTVLQEYKLPASETGKDNDLNDIEQSYFSKGGYFGVAINTTTNEIVGTFGLYAVSEVVYELRKMYLLNHARKKGLGKCILSYAIQLAKGNHRTKIILETISPLKEAISLYKQYGFKEVTPLEINERVDQAFELQLNPCTGFDFQNLIFTFICSALCVISPRSNCFLHFKNKQHETCKHVDKTAVFRFAGIIRFL